MAQHIDDFNGKKVMIGLSAGINSMAILCRLKQIGAKPKELHIYYAHFDEHSPDSFQFVADGIRYARKHFDNVIVKITRNSVIKFFEEQKMIPHPIISPCSRILKIMPMNAYFIDNGLDVDLIGYVKNEKRRYDNMQGRLKPELNKAFPIILFDNDWCFEIIKSELDWYPPIYDLRWNDTAFIAWINENLSRFPIELQAQLLKKTGTDKRVFKHNNCLPCKNMNLIDMVAVEFFYPEYMTKANQLSERLKKHWGRNADDYYTSFGRQEYEAPQCETCSFD